MTSARTNKSGPRSGSNVKERLPWETDSELGASVFRALRSDPGILDRWNWSEKTTRQDSVPSAEETVPSVETGMFLDLASDTTSDTHSNSSSSAD